MKLMSRKFRSVDSHTSDEVKKNFQEIIIEICQEKVGVNFHFKSFSFRSSLDCFLQYTQIFDVKEYIYNTI